MPLCSLFGLPFAVLALTCTGGWLAVSVHCSLELDVRTRDRHTPAGLTTVTSNCSHGPKWQGGRAVKKEEGGRSTSLGQARCTNRCWIALAQNIHISAPSSAAPSELPFPPFLLPPFRCLPVNILPPPSPPAVLARQPPPRSFLFHFQLAAASASVRILPRKSRPCSPPSSSFPLFPISSYFSPSSSRSNSCKFSALSFCFFPLPCDAVANRSHFVTADRQYSRGTTEYAFNGYCPQPGTVSSVRTKRSRALPTAEPNADPRSSQETVRLGSSLTGTQAPPEPDSATRANYQPFVLSEHPSLHRRCYRPDATITSHIFQRNS